jgi:flavodoxin
MNALVLVDSQFGNTEQVAHAIATALAPAFSARLEKADQIAQLDTAGIDLLIVGGPTHRQKMSATLTAVLEAMPRGTLKGVTVAAFDR